MKDDLRIEYQNKSNLAILFTIIDMHKKSAKMIRKSYSYLDIGDGESIAKANGIITDVDDMQKTIDILFQIINEREKERWYQFIIRFFNGLLHE